MKKFCSKCGIRLINKSEKYCDICKAKEVNRHKEYNKYRTDFKEQKFYKSKTWITKRNIIKNKDNGLCLKCLSNKKIVPMDSVHHIEELKDNWDKRLDENNLISLCEQCHQITHLEYKTENKLQVQDLLRSFIKKFRSD